MKRVCVTGAGGFIGGHLCRYLKEQGHWVRGVDIKRPFQETNADEFKYLDLRYISGARVAIEDVDWVFALAADKGGAGYISWAHADIILNSTAISLNTIRAAIDAKVERLLFTSSVCVYPTHLLESNEPTPLREKDGVYPAQPEGAYGFEKLHAEHICRHVREAEMLDTRVVRLHNTYGPCFDEQTEILTDTGFKLFRDVEYQDEVATMNPVGELEYHKPTAIQRYYYEGEMYKLKQGRVVDLLVTPDHSIVWAPGYKLRLRRGKIKEVMEKPTRRHTIRSEILSSRQVNWTNGVPMEDVSLMPVKHGSAKQARSYRGCSKAERILVEDWLTFIGWYLAEGSAFVTPSNYTVAITQNPERYQDEIVALMYRMGYKPYVNNNQIIMSSKQLYNIVKHFGRASDKYIPREYLDLPKRQLQYLFDALMKGDGDADGSRYSTVSKKLADGVQELALKLGYGATVVKEKYSYTGVERSIYRVHLSKETLHRIFRKNITKVQYEGYVYDITVPNHIILVRRNGRIIWSGNCDDTWDNVKAKAPAAFCRKVAVSKITGGKPIEVWGNGKQVRSFMYVEDCVVGLVKLMESDFPGPLNIGYERAYTVDELVSTIMDVAGHTTERWYNPDGPTGVGGRMADNTLCREVLDWEPTISLREGMEKTYPWIEAQAREAMRQQ